MRTIAITGSNGFIGEELTNYFLSKGYRVLALQRNPTVSNNDNLKFLAYSLEKGADENELQEAEVIVHCAFLAWSRIEPDADEINIKATLQLAEFCERNNKQFVFFSSFSAHERASSHYATHKLYLENKLKDKHLVLKPGMVIGKRGMFSNLEAIVKSKSIIPVVGDGKQPLQWIFIDELCRATELAIEKKLIGVFYLASKESDTYLGLLEYIAKKNKKHPWFIHVHPKIAESLLSLFGKNVPFTKENLLGLMQQRSFNTAPSLEKIGISIRNLD
jgi:nucleoside-diphosphate-sugar epimerase